jgi:hypothetical protein
MTEEKATHTRSRRGWAWWVGWVFFVFVVVYPLSVGPVAWWVERTNVTGGVLNFLEDFYAPIIYAYEQNEVVEAFYDWYLEAIWGLD